MTIDQINSYCHSVGMIGSLEQSERLLTNGRTFSKLPSPDRFFKTAANPLLQFVHRIATLVVKIFQALVRCFKNENSALNLIHIENLTRDLKEMLAGSMPEKSKEEFYPTLKSLGRLRQGLNKSIQSGLWNYQKTLLSGDVELFSEPRIERALQADRIDKCAANFSDAILPQVEQFISDMEKEVYEEDIGRFNHFMTSFVNNDELDLSNQFCSKAVIEILKDRYGSGAIERVLGYYQLENQLTVTGNDCVALIIGAAANLTADDFIELNSNEWLGSEEENAQRVIDLRRQINERYLTFDSKARYRKQLKQDQNMLNVFKSLDDWKGEDDQLLVRGLKHYSYAEYLARHVVYGLFKVPGSQFSNGMLIPLYDKTNTLRLYSAYNVVDASGLHGALLKPTYPSEAEDNHVHVVLRGTHDRDSMIRDISPTERMYSLFFDGPGRYSFSRQQDSIYHKILSLIREIPNVNLEFLGHSLGASDAMRALEYILHKETHDQKFDNVKKWELSVFNAPAIEPDISRRFLESLQVLTKETHLRYFEVYHDLVQELGSTRLGYLPRDQIYPDHLNISVYKFNRRAEESAAALARNIFARFSFLLGKSLEAHRFDCLSLREKEDPTKINTTFIQDIISNHPVDIGLHYGNSLSTKSELSFDEAINDELVTNLCLMGRKMRRTLSHVKKSVRQFFLCNPNCEVVSV